MKAEFAQLIDELSSAKAQLESQLHEANLKNTLLLSQIQSSSSQKIPTVDTPVSVETVKGVLIEEETAEISSLRENLSLITAERDSYSQQLTVQTATISELQERIIALKIDEQTYDSVSNRLKEAEDQIERLLLEKTEHDAIRVEFETRNQQLEFEVSALRNDVSHLEKQVNTSVQFDQQESNIYDEIASLRAENATLVHQIESERERSRVLADSLAQMTPTTMTDVALLQRDLAALNDQNEKESLEFALRSRMLETEIAALREELRASEADNSELREQMDGLEGSIVASSRGSPAVTAAAARISGSASVTGNEEDSSTRIMKLTQELQTVNELFEQEAQAFNEKASLMEREISDLKRYLRIAENDNSELREEIDKLQESAVKPDDEKFVMLENEVVDLRRYLGIAEAENSDLREQLDALTANLKNDSTPVPAAGKPQRPSSVKSFTEDGWDSWDIDNVPAPAVPAPQTHLQDAALLISDLEKQIDSLSLDKIKVLEELTRALEQRDVLSKELQSTIREKDSALEKVCSLEDRLEKHLQSVDGALTREGFAGISELDREIDQSPSDTIDTLEHLTTALKERDELSVELQSAQHQRDALHVPQERFEKQAEVLTEIGDNIVRDNSAELAEAIRKERDGLAGRIVNLEEDLKNSRAFEEEHIRTIQSLQESYNRLSAAFEEFKESNANMIRDHEAKIAALDEENEQTALECERLRQAGVQVFDTLQKREEEIDALNTEYERVLADFETVSAALKDLETQNHALIAASEETHIKQGELENKCQALQQQLDSVSTLRNTRDIEISGFKEEFESEKAELLNQIDSLRQAGAKIFQDRQALEEEADTLAAQLDELNSQLAAVTEDRNALEGQVSELKHEVESRSLAQQEVDSRALRFEKLYRDIEAKANNDVSELVDTLRNLTEEFSELKKRFQDQTDELAGLRRNHQDLVSVNEELLAKLNGYEYELTGKAEDLEYKSGQIAELEAQLKAQEANFDIERQNMISASESLRQELRKISDEFSQVERDRELLTQELENLRNELFLRSSQTEDLETLRSQLNEADLRYEQLLTDGEAHTADLEGRLNSALQQIELFEAERNQLLYEVDFLKERLSAEQEFAQSEQKEKESTISAYTEQLRTIEILRNELTTNEDVLQRVTAKLSNCEEQLVNINEEAGSLRMQNLDLNQQITDLRTQLDSTLADIEEGAAAHAELDTLRKVVDGLDRERRELAEEKGHLQTLHEEVHAHCVRMEKELQDLNAANSTLLDQHHTLSKSHIAEKDELQRIVDDMKVEKGNAMAEIDGLRNALDALNADSVSKEDLQLQHQDEIIGMKDALENLKKMHDVVLQEKLQEFAASFAQVEADKQQELEQYIFESEAYKKQINEMSEELAVTQQEAMNFKERIATIENDYEHISDAYKDLEAAYTFVMNEREDLQRKLADGVSALEALKADLISVETESAETLSRKSDEIQALELRIKNDELSHQDNEFKWSQEKTALFDRCSELESSWKTCQAELEGVISQYSHMQIQFEQVQSRLDASILQVQEAAIKLEASEQERLLLVTDGESLHRQLAEMQNEDTSLRSQLDEMQSHVDQSNERIKTLEQLVDTLEAQRAQFNSVINNETNLMQDIARKQAVIERLEREVTQLKSTGSQNTPFSSVVKSFQFPSEGISTQQEVSLLELELRTKEEELASVHTSYKAVVAELEEKINNLSVLNKSSVQSMELYRDELLKKTDRLEALEEENFRIKAKVSIGATPDTSMLDISKYDDVIQRAGKTSRTLDDLLISARSSGSILKRQEKSEILEVLANQISSLLNATETNVSISRKILTEVGSGSRVLSPNRGQDGSIDLIFQSQSSILDGHKKLLRDVESLTRYFKESGSPQRQSLDPSTDSVKSLIFKFTQKVDDYQKIVASLSQTKDSVLQDIYGLFSASNLFNVHTVSGGVLSKSLQASLNILIGGLEDIAAQNVALRKDVTYLASILPKEDRTSGKTVPSQGYHLTSREYNDLVTRASQSDRFQQQLENNSTLLSEQTQEIGILKEAIDGMTAKSIKHSNEVADVQTFKLMSRQIDELKRVWSHELSANMVLRNLIAKTQAESMVAEMEARKQSVSLREEFDELVVIYEEARAESESLQAEIEKRNDLIKRSEDLAEEKLNNRLFEMEQVHIEQNQQLEEMYDKERTALNKLVANLEKERNRLLEDIRSLKEDKGKAGDSTRRELDLKAEVEKLEKLLQEEKKVNERRLLDREIEWQRIRDEENRRRIGGGEMSANYYEDALRVHRNQEEHLRHTLMMRDNQIQTLEIRIQELLQDQEVPRHGASRREIELERDLQAAFTQISNLKAEMAALDHALKVVEMEFAEEKDRSRKLSAKAEDLKRRYQYLLKTQEDSINSALRPNSRGGNAPEIQLYDEINSLHHELHEAKQSRDEIVAILRETLLNTIGEVGVDISIPSATSATSMLRKAPTIDLSRLKSQLSSLIAEVVYLRALANRLFLWRADLKYQKVYLSLKVEDLSESQRATVKFIRGMGVDVPQRDMDGSDMKPIQKFKAGVNVVIAVYRMMVMARDWQDTLQEHNRDYFPQTVLYDDDPGMLTDVPVIKFSVCNAHFRTIHMPVMPLMQATERELLMHKRIFILKLAGYARTEALEFHSHVAQSYSVNRGGPPRAQETLFLMEQGLSLDSDRQFPEKLTSCTTRRMFEQARFRGGMRMYGRVFKGRRYRSSAPGFVHTDAVVAFHGRSARVAGERPPDATSAGKAGVAASQATGAAVSWRKFDGGASRLGGEKNFVRIDDCLWIMQRAASALWKEPAATAASAEAASGANLDGCLRV
ncbi:hypothetical protein HDU83_001626 [Entophlyctis luteolus]|nr:hypothetical protein HDU83_001626 [Entophlyctis luteolus]